eukprot:Tamp_35193.p3 GENE.Tamp_35193~~Tamp_35193.p3  ORF type:complete len:184 (+),score=18.64 Tamp_35193:24-554(+)
MQEESLFWQGTRGPLSRSRAAAGVVLALFLVLFAVAFKVGTAAQRPTATRAMWDREVSGLEFIRKSLETTWLGGPGGRQASQRPSGPAGGPCPIDEVHSCHASCNPKTRRKAEPAAPGGTGRAAIQRPQWLSDSLFYYKCMHRCLGHCEKRLANDATAEVHGLEFPGSSVVRGRAS